VKRHQETPKQEPPQILTEKLQTDPGKTLETLTGQEWFKTLLAREVELHQKSQMKYSLNAMGYMHRRPFRIRQLKAD
jgi:hypothetical protein